MTTDLNLRDAVIDNTHRAGDDELRIYLDDGRRVTITGGGPRLVFEVEDENGTKVT
jgi:hypothetical protein